MTLRWPILAACAIALVLLIGVSIGPIALSPAAVLAALSGRGDPAAVSIIWEIRLPRAVAALSIGAALGMAGAALQGLLRNPLAEPGVLGVSATAAMTATATLYFGAAAIAPVLVPLASLAGALLATALITLAAFRVRAVSSLILLGVALSALSGAVMALFVNLAPNPFSLSDLINWTAGSVANRDWADIGFAAPFMLAGMACLIRIQRSLSALSVGEDVAHGLGVDLTQVRFMAIIGTGLATGGAVALAGVVGFIGLIAPHAVRPFVGHDPGRTLLPAAAAGAVLAGIADTAVRLFPWGSELHLGTLAALAGAPLFIWLVFLTANRRHD